MLAMFAGSLASLTLLLSFCPSYCFYAEDENGGNLNKLFIHRLFSTCITKPKTNGEHMSGGTLLHSPAVSIHDGPPSKSPSSYPFHSEPFSRRIDQFPVVMRLAGVPLISSVSYKDSLTSRVHVREECHVPKSE